MDKFDNKEYLEAVEEMKKFRKTTDILTALQLINQYSQLELESIVSKIPVNFIERIEIRFQIVSQLLFRQMNKSEAYRDSASKQESDDEKYCDFKRVMKILNSSKAKVDSLIAKKMIVAGRDAIGGKRRFITADIYKYAERLHE